jgi:lysophospholipid acyltransferase (LPLAT)-like uncharacterized protein
MAEDKLPPRITLAAVAGAWFLRALGATWRFRARHAHELAQFRADKHPVIFALWHGHLLPLLYFHRGEDIAILISEHGDGEIIARIAHSLGYRTVRGSSSRGAARALLTLVREVDDGHDLAITPDGPRGPAKSVAPGTTVVARRGGAAIIPIAAHASSAWRLGSWDSFMIPKPFARVTVGYGDALDWEKGSTGDLAADAEALSAQLATAEERAGA